MINLSPSFWVDLGNHLWQATMFCLFIAGLIYLLKRYPARIRYYIGWIGLLKFFLPSALLLLVLGDVVRSTFTSNTILTESIWPLGAKISEPLFLFKSLDYVTIETHFPYENILVLLGLIWVSGSLSLFVFWQIKVCQLHNQIKENAEPVSESINSKINALKDSLGLKCQISALLVRKDIEPGVFGIVRPELILTRKLLEEFTSEELDLVLIHELFHIKHRDNLWAQLQVVILCLFWFHPLVWWLNRRITLECEKACDEAVIKYSGGKKSYASAIYKVFQLHSGWNIYGYSGITQTGLKNRIQSILNFEASGISIAKYRSVIASVLIFLGISIIAGGMTPLIKESSSKTMTAQLLEGRELLIEPLSGSNENQLPHEIVEETATDYSSTAPKWANENINLKQVFNKKDGDSIPHNFYVELENYLSDLDYERYKISRTVNELKKLNHINPSYETINVERLQVGTIIGVLVQFDDYSNYPRIRKSFERVEFVVIENISGKYKDLEQISFPYNIESDIKPQVRKSYYGDNIWIGSSTVIFKNKTVKRKLETLIIVLNELDKKESDKFQKLRDLKESSTKS